MSHDFYMVDQNGDTIIKPGADGIVGCQRCGETISTTVTYNHTPHIDFALREFIGADQSYWKWLVGKKGKETLPALRKGYCYFAENFRPSEDEKDFFQNAYFIGLPKNQHENHQEWWNDVYLAKREDVVSSLCRLHQMARDAPEGVWAGW